ncbi:RNA polymerase I-specific transcription initiation factor RRN3 [Artomyces pyxidatus]|uniref:RNA polymerase I-specific transcription initiation factor RRN3 n=1 Tax=Artomyces pyxidatus TaxID=48021 RepID=A0ACB8SP39_9AGAM|nr:RNA polymerase I-specific transcription initiation factor RRN3 [Artomyces pyxidatus]
MDPHSRLSQFNQRPPKAGPLAPVKRHTERPHPTLDGFTKSPGPTASKKSSTASPLSPRPIATNSRIKQDERLRKDMHLAFVNNALHQKLMGNSEPFDELVDQFNLKKTSGDAPSPVPQLRLWLQALMHVVSRLDRTHASLVEAIVRMPWMTMDSSFVKSYTSFIEILVSARPEYLSLVLGKIAEGLTYQSGLQALDAGLPESSSAPLTRRIVYDRIHYLLRHLLSLVPTLPSTLQPLLSRNFPHKRQSLANQVTYIRNMLQITEYCPEIADRLLSTIIDRAIQIDVEIQVELEELEAADATQEQADLFDLDPFDTVVGQEAADDSDSEDDLDEGDNISDLSSEAGELEDDASHSADGPLDFNHITDMVTKLDAILYIIFNHLSRTHISLLEPSPPDTPNSSDPPSRSESPLLSSKASSSIPLSAERRKVLLRSRFHTLLSIFDRTILRTFKSRYTQFLVFWFASLDPEFSDTFQGTLVSKALLEPDQPVVTRAAAASYIASFVSRAAFVDREGARNVVRVLCRFLRHQLELFEGSTLDCAPLGVFYAVAQAVFLVFCFRWRDLLEDEPADEFDDFGAAPRRKWMEELNIVQRIVTCALNPLKMCSENVILQFARVAQATGFVYIYPIIEANRRHDFTPNTPSGPQSQPSLLSSIYGDKVLGELNTFFPFDPYKLPKSSAYIESIYRDWSAVAIDEEDDEDEDEDDEEEIVGRPVGEDLDGGLGASFGGMSISPAAPGLVPIVV